MKEEVGQIIRIMEYHKKMNLMLLKTFLTSTQKGVVDINLLVKHWIDLLYWTGYH